MIQPIDQTSQGCDQPNSEIKNNHNKAAFTQMWILKHI